METYINGFCADNYFCNVLWATGRLPRGNVSIKNSIFFFVFALSYWLGIFGGMAPLIATYLIEKANAHHTTDYYLAGLTYPIVVMMVSLIIGFLYLRENNMQTSVIMSAFSSKINKLKRGLGIVWIALGLVTAYFGVFHLGLPNIMSGKQDDLIFGLIMMLIITPVASVGLLIFGKYALTGEYDDEVIPYISPVENLVVSN